MTYDPYTLKQKTTELGRFKLNSEAEKALGALMSALKEALASGLDAGVVILGADLELKKPHANSPQASITLKCFAVDETTPGVVKQALLLAQNSKS